MTDWQDGDVDKHLIEKLTSDIACLPDSELLERVIKDAVGDDYEGYFTNIGLWIFEREKEELYRRLPESFRLSLR